MKLASINKINSYIYQFVNIYETWKLKINLIIFILIKNFKLYFKLYNFIIIFLFKKAK